MRSTPLRSLRRAGWRGRRPPPPPPMPEKSVGPRPGSCAAAAQSPWTSSSTASWASCSGSSRAVAASSGAVALCLLAASRRRRPGASRRSHNTVLRSSDVGAGADPGDIAIPSSSCSTRRVVPQTQMTLSDRPSWYWPYEYPDQWRGHLRRQHYRRDGPEAVAQVPETDNQSCCRETTSACRPRRPSIHS